MHVIVMIDGHKEHKSYVKDRITRIVHNFWVTFLRKMDNIEPLLNRSMH